MPDGRDAIPAAVRRDILVEAGHRCAIPTCRQTPVEIAHIVPWAQSHKHTFDNLIALCPTCHARYDAPRSEIDRLAMRQYKSNLSVLNQRYGDLERRVLQRFADDPELEIIEVLGNMEILLMFLIRDGLLDALPLKGAMFVTSGMLEQQFRITAKGRDFVSKWLTARPLEQD
jgi:hypothetical protein